MCRGHQKIGDEIILYGLHAAYALTAPCLIAEEVRIHAFDVAAVCHRDNNHFVRNQVFGLYLIADA